VISIQEIWNTNAHINKHNECVVQCKVNFLDIKAEKNAKPRLLKGKIPFNEWEHEVKDNVRANDFHWVKHIKTSESEVVYPNQFESEAHLDVNIVDVLDTSLSQSDKHPVECDEVGRMQFNDQEQHPGGDEDVHEGMRLKL